MKNKLFPIISSIHCTLLITLLCVTQYLQAADQGLDNPETKPTRILSSTPSVTGILLAIDAPVVASATTTPSRLTDAKGFFSQWADVADKRQVNVLYNNLKFDIEAVISWNPDLLIVSSTGADSIVEHLDELHAQGVPTLVVNYSDQSWQDIALQLGKTLGLENNARNAIRRFDHYAAEVASTISVPQGTVSLVAYKIAGNYAIGRPSSPQARLLSALGFTVAGLPGELESKVTRASDFEFISRENLSSAITGDTVFLLSATQKDVQAFLDDPVLANLPAVVNKRVYALGPTSFRIDYYSGRQVIDTVASYFK